MSLWQTQVDSNPQCEDRCWALVNLYVMHSKIVLRITLFVTFRLCGKIPSLWDAATLSARARIISTRAASSLLETTSASLKKKWSHHAAKSSAHIILKAKVQAWTAALLFLTDVIKDCTCSLQGLSPGMGHARIETDLFIYLFIISLDSDAFYYNHRYFILQRHEEKQFIYLFILRDITECTWNNQVIRTEFIPAWLWLSHVFIRPVSGTCTVFTFGCKTCCQT